jgi:8-oxo-dGTP pyrophosphatase MutT (NUDIX family)
MSTDRASWPGRSAVGARSLGYLIGRNPAGLDGSSGAGSPYPQLLMRPADDPVDAPRRAIRRPPHHRAGAPAPWAGLPAADRRALSLDRVQAALSQRPPAPVGARVEPWRSLGGAVPARPAAVLVPLFEEEGEARIVLTVRSDRLRAHTGEVAFPGGRLDGDEGVVEGALREASEEVGLDPGSVTVIGQLTAMPTISTDTVMTPVVGTLRDRPSLIANPGEVERVFDVGIRELTADGAFHEELWSVPGRAGAPGYPEGEFPVWFFDVAGETVWGATARTLVELICLVLGVAPPPTLRPL